MGNAINISLHITSDSGKHAGKITKCVLPRLLKSCPNHSKQVTTASVMPGHTILGTVMIDVKKRHKVGVVQLIVQGKEEVRRMKTDYSSSDDQPRKIARRNEKEILRWVIPLADKNHQWVEQGTYPLNFEIDLPEHIPPSVRFGNDNDGWSIQYNIAVSVLGYQQKEWPLLVRSLPAPSIQPPLLLQPVQQRVDTMGFFRDGHVTIGARLDRKTVGRGQFVHVTVACVNDTSVDVRSVSIKLVQVISTTIDSEKHYQKVNLADVKVAEFYGMVLRTRPKESVYSVYVPTQRLTGTNVQSASQRIHDALTNGNRNRNTVQIKIPTVSDLRCVKVRIAHVSLISHESSIDCQ